MNTNTRLQMLNEKLNNDKEIEARNEQKEDELCNNLIGKVRELQPKISELLELADNLKELGISNKIPDKFIADGIKHDVGFMGYGRKFEFIGFYNGGYCGVWDFYTDGEVVFEKNDSAHTHNERKPIVKHLQTFLKEFEAFYTEFLEWFDGFTNTQTKEKTSTCERYYKVEMVNGSGTFPDKYKTYEDAYAAMCRNFVREENEGYKPTLYKIMRYDYTEYNGSKNTMVQPTWN